MHSRRFDKFSHGHLAWLLWLAMLLPLAQTAATSHLLSHVPSTVSWQQDDQHAIHADHCDQCLNALAVTGGAPLLQSDISLVALVPASTPRFNESRAWFVRQALPYESRAPPRSSH